MAIISQNIFDNYSYSYDKPWTRNILVSNAGYISLAGNNSEKIGSYYEIDFGDDITHIGSNCCKGEKHLQLVTFSDNLEEIQEYAFTSCYSLFSLEFPSSLKKLYPYCFYLCYNLSSINIPDGITDIPFSGFEMCDLRTLYFPKSVSCIQEQAIRNNPLEKVIFNEGLKVIDNWAFEYCSLTGNLQLPNTIEYIGTGAFGDTDISSVNIPINAKIPMGNPFYGCYNLTGENSVNIDFSNAKYLKRGGNYGIINDKNSLVIPCTFADEDEGEQIYSIGEWCFADSYDLTSMSFEEKCLSTVSSINECAFAYSNFSSIKLTNQLSNIGWGTFYSSQLTSINLPSTLTELKPNTFSYTLLSTITIPDSISSIGWGCFGGCTYLKEIIFDGNYDGKTIPKLDNGAFDQNANLQIYVTKYELVTLLMNDPIWRKYIDRIQVIPNSNNLADFYVTSIPDQTFSFEPLTPEITVKCGPYVIDNNELDIQYIDNIDVGTATAIISAKQNSQYTGQISKTFKILPADISEGEETTDIQSS